MKGLKSGFREYLHLIGRVVGDGCNFKSPSGDLGVDLDIHLIKPIDKQK